MWFLRLTLVSLCSFTLLFCLLLIGNSAKNLSSHSLSTTYMTVSLKPVPQQGIPQRISAQAELAGSLNGSYILKVSAKGLEPNKQYEASVYHGTCEKQGPSTGINIRLFADVQGNTSQIETGEALSPKNESWSIQIDDGEHILACGDLEPITTLGSL